MRTGRPPASGESRGKTVPVRFSATEIKAVDQARGAQTRSDFVRQAVNDAARAGKK